MVCLSQLTYQGGHRSHSRLYSTPFILSSDSFIKASISIRRPTSRSSLPRSAPAIVLGDTNTGQPGIDEESKFFNRKEGQWMRSLRDSGWLDAWRALHGDQRVYSWHEPRQRKGFRIDQAFLNDAALHRLMSITYDWGTQDDGKNPSDHAAMILDIKDAPAPE